MFSPGRLSVARQRSLLTKTELATRVGIDARTVSGYEKGQYEPSDEVVERIAAALSFPKAFFYRDDLDIPHQSGVSFRSLSRMTSRQRDAAIAAGALGYLLCDWVESEFDLPEVDLPDLRENTPETAAMSLRQLWGLGEKPIKNAIHLLESKGVRVFSLAEHAAEVDAYSVWRGKRPCIFLNTGKSSERRRFDACHELGHLLLHRHAGPGGVDAEKEANAFASALLMPAASLKALGRVLTVDGLIAIKQKWIVSVAALAYRLHDLRLMSDWNYHMICVEISTRNYRRVEPEGAKMEASQVWQKVFTELRKEGKGLAYLSERLTVPADEIAKLVFGLVTIEAPARATPAVPRYPGAHLRLVK